MTAIVAGFASALVCTVLLGMAMVYKPVEEAYLVKQRIWIALVAIVLTAASMGFVISPTLDSLGFGMLGALPFILLGLVDLIAYVFWPSKG